MRRKLLSLALAAFAFAAAFAFVGGETVEASGCYQYNHYMVGDCHVTEVYNTCTGCVSIQWMCPGYDYEDYYC